VESKASAFGGFWILCLAFFRGLAYCFGSSLGYWVVSRGVYSNFALKCDITPADYGAIF